MVQKWVKADSFCHKAFKLCVLVLGTIYWASDVRAKNKAPKLRHPRDLLDLAAKTGSPRAYPIETAKWYHTEPTGSGL